MSRPPTTWTEQARTWPGSTDSYEPPVCYCGRPVLNYSRTMSRIQTQSDIDQHDLWLLDDLVRAQAVNGDGPGSLCARAVTRILELRVQLAAAKLRSIEAANGLIDAGK